MKAVMKLEVIDRENPTSDNAGKVAFRLTCGDLKLVDYNSEGKILYYGTDVYMLSREVTGATYENNSTGIFDLQNTVTLQCGDFTMRLPPVTEFTNTQDPEKIQKNFQVITKSLEDRCKKVSDWVKDVKANIEAAKTAVEFILGEDSMTIPTGKRISDTFDAVDFSKVPAEDQKLIQKKTEELLEILEPYADRVLDDENHG